MVPDVYATSAGVRGSTGAASASGSSAMRSANAMSPVDRAPCVADDRDPLEVGQVGAHRGEVGEEVLVPEAVGGDERLHARLAQDVADLLRSVEVHDRHDDRAEVRDRVERRRRFQPVRQLERDRVAGLRCRGRAGRPRRARASASTSPSVPRYGVRSERTVNGMGGGVVQPVGEQAPRRLVVPEALAHVAPGAFGVDLAGREVHGLSLASSCDGAADCGRWWSTRTIRQTLARFWADVLDWTIFYEADDEVVITKDDKTFPGLVFVPVPEAKTVKNRLHIDLNPDDQDAEVERLVGLGATRGRHRPGRRRVDRCSPIPKATSSACCAPAKAACRRERVGGYRGRPEHALGDDVALDLARAARDRAAEASAGTGSPTSPRATCCGPSRSRSSSSMPSASVPKSSAFCSDSLP